MTISLKQKITAAIIALGLILIAIFKFGLDGTPVPVVNNESTPSGPALISSDPPALFKKEPLVIPPSQVLTLNFSVPLQNGPETKIALNPPHEVEIKLSDDYKSAIITPKTPYKLGQGYSVFINRETKLREEGKILGQDYDFHFNVINYSGI